MNPEPDREDAIRVPGPSASPPPIEPPEKLVHAGTSPIKIGIYAGVGFVALAALCYFGIPMILLAWNTVSTDDAYVNSHATFVAARVPGQVVKVRVDDNNRVKKGDLLVLLDEEPYQVMVNLKTAVLATAKADEEVSLAQVRGMVAQARSFRFKLEHSIESVNNDVAQLRATVAGLDSDLAKRDRTLKDFERIKTLMKTPGAATQQDLDLKLQDYLVAKAKVRQSLEGVYQLRAALGLSTKPVNADEITQAPKNLADTPADLDQTFSTVRQAAAALMQTAAPLGVVSSSFDLTPKKILEEFLNRDPEGNIDRIYAKIIKNAPALAQAKAKILQAQRDLDQAKLNLSYCRVHAEIDGVVTRRNVNEGNNVQAGQSLMAIRSLSEIWIDANFKETQLADLRIGQPCKIEVDMYGSRKEYEGRITGFTMGTGQTLALLPPQNATGNYVKIVQRLPVKIELTDYDPDQDPLFVGLSVTPYVYIRRPLVGDDPGKGKALQPYLTVGEIVSAAVASIAIPRPAINPWIIAAAVVVPAFMEVLDTTIANVALQYIAGGLAAARTDGEWVITSYLAANAIVLPISGWLSAQLGRRNYFLLSIAIFTLASALCGMATSLTQIIVYRVIQGLAGGGLQPSSQAVLMDSFPAEKQGTAMTLFGIAALIGPIVGPTLGGWLVVNYDWRYIFYINVPVGLMALASCYFLVHDPEYLKQERAELRRRPLNFDYIGLGLLSLALASWEVLLSKGQEWDWLSDPFWRIQTLVVLFVGGVAFLVFRELRIDKPIVNFRVLAERNLAMSGIIIFCAFGVLYAASISLPALLQSQFGYDALAAGLVLSPGGISSISALVVVGFLLGRGVDARWLIAAGLLVLAASNYWMAHMNLQVGPRQVIGPRMVLTGGLGLIFAPINLAAFKYTPQHLRGAAVGLLALLRNEGGSVGTSMAQTIQVRREQFHSARIGDTLDPFNPAVTNFLDQSSAGFFQQTGDAAAANQMALQALENARLQQAASLAYFDVFWLAAVLGVMLVALVFLMKRSVAEKGEHLAAD